MNLPTLVANPRVLITPFGLHPAEFVVIVFIILIIFIFVRRRYKIMIFVSDKVRVEFMRKEKDQRRE